MAIRQRAVPIFASAHAPCPNRSGHRYIMQRLFSAVSTALAHRFSIPRNPVSSLAHARDLADPRGETGFLYWRSSTFCLIGNGYTAD
jgi:hypothetical protein